MNMMKAMTSEQLITDNLDIWTQAIKPKSSAGRGNGKNGKVELYGIKKLRELILELAVRGLLVPQDPNDEPASELLKKIAAEKAKLIKEGKIKKQKSLPSISEEEKPFELPKGWEWCRLAEISQIVRGITFPSNEKFKEPASGRIACLRTSNVQDSIEWEDLLFIREQFVKREDQYIVEHDIVMSMANSRELVGKVAIVSKAPEFKTSFGGFLGVIRAHHVNPLYIVCLLRAPTNRTILINSASQTTNIANVSLGKLNPMVFPLPSLEEQGRIVSKVGELMSLCDQLEQQTKASLTAHQTLVETLLNALTNEPDNAAFEAAWQCIAEHFDNLFTTEHSIDQLKQTILQLAVMGKLVPQDPNDEPASELLKKIAAEKAKLIKEGKIKKQKPLPTITDEEKPFELPAGWEWCRLDDLSHHSEAGWSPKCHDHPKVDDNWGVLKVSAVTWGIFKPEENKELPIGLNPRPEYEIQKNDFLISRANTADLVARSVVVEGNAGKHLMMSDKIIRFSFSSFVLPKYINLVNNSQWSRIYYSKVAGGTSSSMKNVSRKQIQMLTIALPPLSEQHDIIAKVDELMALCDQLKARLTDVQTSQLQLADTITEQIIN